MLNMNLSITDTFRLKLIIILALGFLAACQSDESNENTGKPQIEFDHLEFDFGIVKQGEKVAHRFVFKNTGNGKLKIKHVSADCGCTVASFPDKEIGPGEESFIEATFNSEGYRGLNIKQIEVYTNGEPRKVVLSVSATIDDEMQPM